MTQLEFLKCLSDETRLNIVMLLMRNRELCVCDLIDALQLSQPKISRHLALLRRHQLLRDARKGQWVYYAIHPQLPDWALQTLHSLSQDFDYSALKSISDNNSCCE